MTGPQVCVNPAMRFGAPNVRGVSYYAITDQLGAGSPVEEVANEYGIDRNDVLVACWYAGLYGTRGERRWLMGWAKIAGSMMWADEWDQIDDPPGKPKRGKR